MLAELRMKRERFRAGLISLVALATLVAVTLLVTDGQTFAVNDAEQLPKLETLDVG